MRETIMIIMKLMMTKRSASFTSTKPEDNESGKCDDVEKDKDRIIAE